MLRRLRDKPLISLVMIVKNEAAILRETLERCGQW